MIVIGLLLDAESRRARREDDAILFPLGKRHIEEPQMRRIIRLRSHALPLGERLVLPFGGIALSFFISRSVGLLRRGPAPRLERLAEQHAASCAEGRVERFAFAQFVTEQSATRRAGGVTDNASSATPRAAAEQRASEEWKNET